MMLGAFATKIYKYDCVEVVARRKKLGPSTFLGQVSLLQIALNKQVLLCFCGGQ